MIFHDISMFLPGCFPIFVDLPDPARPSCRLQVSMHDTQLVGVGQGLSLRTYMGISEVMEVALVIIHFDGIFP